jgi:hypothetical protein
VHSYRSQTLADAAPKRQECDHITEGPGPRPKGEK